MNNYSGNETFGAKFNRDLDVKDIAKLVRADIKAGIKSGRLPTYLKASVRISRYSMGQSINIGINEPGLPVYTPEYRDCDDRLNFNRDHDTNSRYTPGYQKLVSDLKELLESYNRDDSDSMVDYFDVNFYGHVNLHHGYSADFEKAFLEGKEVA